MERFRDEVGAEASRMCGGCHDVALLFDGAMKGEVAPADPRAHAGIGCRTCHGIESVTRDGNGSYALAGAPIPLPDASDPKSVARHRRAAAPIRSPEMCGSCHRSFLEPATGNAHFLPGQDELGAWSNSPWAGSGLGRVDEELPQKTCIDCHMAPEEATRGDAAADEEGRVSSHRFPGGHTWLARMRGDEEQLAAVRAQLRRAATIDVAAAVGGDGRASLPADGAAVVPGEEISLDVVVRNVGVGHKFPAGVRDAQDTWVEVVVRDARGRRVAVAGVDHRERAKDPSAHRFRALLVGEEGAPLFAREVHRFAAPIIDHTIPPRDVAVVRYAFEVPRPLPEASLPLAIEARLLHRTRNLRLQREACASARDPRGRAFARAARRLGRPVLDPCGRQPITVLAEREIWIGDGWRERAAAEEGSGRPAWRRLYEHGLGLLHTVQERVHEAEPSLRAALAALEPEQVRERAMVVSALGVLAGRQGRTGEAMSLFDEAERLAPGHPAIGRLRARALARGWKWEEAADALAPAARAAPTNVTGFRELAIALGSAGRHREALAAAQRGLALTSRAPALLRVQALSLRALGAPEKTVQTALDAFDRHRRPDRQAELRIACARRVEGCAREREPVPLRPMKPVW